MSDHGIEVLAETALTISTTWAVVWTLVRTKIIELVIAAVFG